jgi:hypothetical protein
MKTIVFLGVRELTSFANRIGPNERSAAAGYLRDVLVRFSGKRPDDL